MDRPHLIVCTHLHTMKSYLKKKGREGGREREGRRKVG
jgi:hypothetical protein